MKSCHALLPKKQNKKTPSHVQLFFLSVLQVFIVDPVDTKGKNLLKMAEAFQVHKAPLRQDVLINEKIHAVCPKKGIIL